ncbi:MAG: TolB family protein, partial [bacterium]
LFAAWLLSLPGGPQAPAATAPATAVSDVTAEGGDEPVAPEEQAPDGTVKQVWAQVGTFVSRARGLGAWVWADVLAPPLAALSAFLVVGALLMWLLALALRRRRAGRVMAVAGFLPLLLAVAALAQMDMSWRLFPALLNGYHYDPNTETPDPRLVWRRPEVIIERQLEALLGETGPDPLREDAALADYRIDRVHIEGWQHWVTARLETTLTFADGASKRVTLTLPARGGHMILFPLLGEVSASAYAWYPPEGTLGALLQTPATATPLQNGAPPVTLEAIHQLDGADVIEPMELATGSVNASGISAEGDLLVDVDLRENGRNVGYAILLQTAGGDSQVLARARLAGRASFSPDGRRISYVRFNGEAQYAELVVRDVTGSEQDVGAEQRIGAVDWMDHHWVGNDRLAFTQNGVAYLYDLSTGASLPIGELEERVPDEFRGSSHFRVSPDGSRFAYVDFEEHLLVEDLDSGEQRRAGWDAIEAGWWEGIAWRPDGRQLVYTAVNNVTLPGQSEVWLWDAMSGERTLLARTGSGFLNGDVSGVRLGNVCWANETTVLFTANITSPLESVHLIAASTDGRGLWDVTPEDALIPVGSVQCTNGHVAVNTERTTLAVYEIQGVADQ